MMLKRGEVSTAVLAAERLLKSAPTPANAERVLASLARVVAKSRDLSTDWRAEILKVRGAALEICGDTAAAIATYEQGLSLKPKLAVKRRLTALRKAAPSS